MHKPYGRLLILRAVAALALGTVALCWPRSTMAVVLLLLAVYSFVDGVLSIAGTVTGRRAVWAGIGRAVLEIGLAVFIIASPAITRSPISAVVGAWSIAAGALELAISVDLRHAIKAAGWLVLTGLVSCGFGIVLIAKPHLEVQGLTWAFAIHALARGGTMLSIGISLLARSRGAGRWSSKRGRGPSLFALHGIALDITRRHRERELRPRL